MRDPIKQMNNTLFTKVTIYPYLNLLQSKSF